MLQHRKAHLFDMSINEYHMDVESQSYSYVLSLKDAKQEQAKYLFWQAP